MKKTALTCIAAMLPLLLLASSDSSEKNTRPAYPPARTVPQTDVFHGVSVPDPYRWMEELDAPETKAWARAQDDFGVAHLRALPAYAKFKERILALNRFESVSPPALAGGLLFFTRTPLGAQARATIEVATSDTAPSRVLVDSNQWPPEETLGMVLPSFDGKRVAFAVRRNSSNWYDLRFLDVATGKVLPDVVSRAYGAAAWSRDNAGVYYGTFPLAGAGQERTQKLENQKLRYHRIGAAPSEDALVLESPQNPTWRFAPRETDDGEFLVITASIGTSRQNGIFVRAARQWNEAPRQIIPVGGDMFLIRGSRGPVLWLQTNAGAPRGRVIAVDLRHPEPANWSNVVAESADTLNLVNVVDQRFLAVYVRDARHTIKVFSAEGELQREVKFPELGTTFSGFIGAQSDRYSYYSFNAPAYPPGASVFRLDARTGESVPFRQPKLSHAPADYETRLVFYTSKDGTRVPLHISAKKGVKLDGRNPVLMYAYGAAGWHAIPWYQPQVLAWMEAGGVYALANVRGGGEYGQQWHQAGIKKNKQNTIDDFIAAAEWLIANRYTSRDRLAINGGSLSSPLAGAALVQRPELFGAVLMDISVTDMVRYDRFTGGVGWRAELGSASDPEEFRALLAYSPYHNLKPGTCYPPTLITAGERDETTVPSHSYKFAAALQAAQGCAKPALLQIMWGTGHTLGNTREQSAEILGRQLAFLDSALNGKNTKGTAD